MKNKPALIIGGFAIITLLAFLAGYLLRGNSPSNTAKTQRMDTSMMKNMEMGMMDHGSMINSEADFIMEMIPHHQEAIDSSQYMLTRTDDEEFKQFLQTIIDAQTKEISMMKQWHQDWFNEPYEDNGQYEKMMPDLERYLDNSDARFQYLRAMIMHHMGAVQMAAKIKTITERDELISFANEIIRAQNNEIVQMRQWMMESRGEDGMMHRMGN